MAGSTTSRVDPRALLGVVGARPPGRDIRRVALISTLAAIGLAAFGAVVVRANDDAGVLAFIRDQARSVAARPTQSSAHRFYHPSSWFRSAERAPERGGTRRDRHSGPRLVERGAIDRSAGLATAYSSADAPVVRLPSPATQDRRFLPMTDAHRAPPRPSAGISRGSAVAYCVRTCDGYFFPLGPSTGSEAGDAAACSSLCPAAETRLFSRRIGDEMDEGRDRATGRRYSALPAAFKHRAAYSASCSCTGEGLGLATNFPVSRDPTLRVGDAVMTSTGMKVFHGGRLPYRSASFTPVRNSGLVDGRTRETLRRMEQASLPGRSGVAPQPLATRPAHEPRLAAKGSLEDATAFFRPVGMSVAAVR